MRAKYSGVLLGHKKEKTREEAELGYRDRTRGSRPPINLPWASGESRNFSGSAFPLNSFSPEVSWFITPAG